VFIHNEKGASLASSNRYTPLAFHSIILDMHLLARTDFLVCTMSSTLCRVLVELLQLSHSDASWRFRSLDEYFYVYAGHRIHHTALYDHAPFKPSSGIQKKSDDNSSAAVRMLSIVENELELKRGDLVEFIHYESKDVRGFKMNGYVLAKNLRTGLTGHIPKYKVYNRILFDNARKSK
jgi:hypothetical protein